MRLKARWREIILYVGSIQCVLTCICIFPFPFKVPRHNRVVSV